ncbi:MAG: Maf-like protein [Myxococcales bacterium]|nr:Maf-like protein [Myxococcales bacterium]
MTSPIVQLAHGPAPLVLASTSRWRLAQLARLGLKFACVKPAYAELPVAGLAARALIAHHARAKAMAVATLPQWSRAFVLGGDQGVVLGDGADAELLGKPGTEDAAVAQLLRLAGRRHDLVTSIALVGPGGGTAWEHTDVTTLTVRLLTEPEARAYVRRDQPLDCAGSYRIEAAGPWLFEAIVGEDPTAIEGLPLLAVCRLLRAAGFSVGP